MSGNPLLRLAALVAALAITWLLVQSATRRETTRVLDRMEAAERTAPVERTVQVDVESSAEPTTLSLTANGEPVEVSAAAPVSVGIPAGRVDFVVRAEWSTPESVRNALRVRVQDGGHTLIDQTFWGDASLAEAFTVPDSESP